MANKITKKSDNISEWYNQIVEQAGLAEHGPVRGTMIFKPRGYALWEGVQKELDGQIKEKLNAQNVYFPLFFPISFIEKEKAHVKGFSPELAIVTHAGGEKLEEPIVVRPTSETIINDAFSRWIQSFRDLPVIINQWANVVRWEMRPYYFLRSTEFLWQEGHTCHLTNEEAQKMVDDALKIYIDVYQNTLGLYGIAGRKSETEKFAGADQTFTYEILMPDGKVVQACTSHNLGQNFAKVFKVMYQDQKGEQQHPFQTSWGFSTRSLGALILAHGDDNGLVLPPNLAPTQVVVIPIVSKQADSTQILELAKKVEEILEKNEIRVKLDDSDQSPGWKFNQYELEGVPFRIEIGASEVREEKVTVTRRDNKIKLTLSLEELVDKLQEEFVTMQAQMFEKTKSFTHQNTHQANTYEEFKKIMAGDRGFIEAFWCENAQCEAKIKEETKANTRCLPFDSPEVEGKCIYCGKKATHRWLFGQSY